MSRTKSFTWPADIWARAMIVTRAMGGKPRSRRKVVTDMHRFCRNCLSTQARPKDEPWSVSRSFPVLTQPTVGRPSHVGFSPSTFRVSPSNRASFSTVNNHHDIPNTPISYTSSGHPSRGGHNAGKPWKPSPDHLSSILKPFFKPKPKQARSQTHPAPSTSPRTGSTEARPLAVSNFQLLVHARHPVARGVASESLDFHQSLQSEHRIPSTIIPPLSVLHLLYSAIRQQDQLQYLTGSDWNMFLFWLSYHKDRTLFGQLRELLMGPMAIVPSQGRISEEALQILAPSRTQTKSRVKSTKNYGASVPGSSIQKTVTEYEPGVPPTVTTENFKIENQDHLNTVSPEQQAQQAHQAQQDLSSETVYASGSTPAKPKKRSRGNDSSEQSPLDFDSALASFRAALEGSRKPSIEVSNALLKGLVQKERLEEALALFRTLTEYHGVTPNEETFRHLMKVAAAYGHLAMARSIISSLNSLRVSLDGAIYRDLIKCYVRSGNLSGAIRMFERMGSGYINGEIRHINALLEGTTGGNHTMLYEVSLAGSKRPTTKVSPLTTLGILEVMAATGRRPNAKTWYHLLNGAFKVKDRIISQQLFMEMSREVAGHKGHQHQESSVDGKKTKQTQKSIPVVGHASRHPDTFLLLVEEYAKRYGVDPAANLLRGALDAEYPVWVNESLRQWLNGMNSEEN